MAEFFDIGKSRTVAWGRRPRAAALVARLADPGRGWDAIMVGEYERVFYGAQYAAMAPLFEHYGVQLWMPEAGGRVDYRSEHAGPHPSKAHATWGRRAHRLEPDPGTAHVVRWIFAQRLAGYSVARIARALNEAGIPCPSAAGPGRNPHRTGAAWTLGAVTAILSSPRYTGHQVWNRQRTGKDLIDPANVSLGDKSVQRWNLPGGWVISDKPAHPALVSEADFIAAQDINAARGPAPRDAPAGPGKRRYLLAGLLACGTCGQRMEPAWSNGKPACRCRHGHASAMPPDPDRPENAYVREDRLLPRLPGLYLRLTGTGPAGERRRREPEPEGGERKEPPVARRWRQPAPG